MKMKRVAVLITTACLILAGAASWLLMEDGSATLPSSRNTSPAALRPIPTALVRSASPTTAREFPGEVQATQRVELAFAVSGTLVELNALEGRAVEKGEVLARLDPRDYQNAVDSAQARYDEARRNLERARQLVADKVLSQSKLDEAKAAFEVTEAELRAAEKALEDSVIRAPFQGVVAKRHVENHEYVEPIDTILSLQDASRIEVIFQAPERLVAVHGVEGLRDVQVEFDAVPGQWHEANLREYRTQADPVTRAYDLVVALEPPADLQILPGMTATVRLTVPAENVNTNPDTPLLVPPAAVFAGANGRPCVWVIGEDGTPDRTPVTVGELHEAGIEVLDGLAAGERVAVAGVHTLTENMRVRPMAPDRRGLEG